MSKISLPKPEIVQVTSYYPPHLGGMENYAAQVAERFAGKGYTVSVYTSNIGYSPQIGPDFKAHVHYLKSLEFAHTPIIFALFFRLLALPCHSLIHLHVSQALSPEIVYVVSRIKKIPYIAHVHIDADPSGPFGFLLGPYKKVFLGHVLKSASKIICLSDSQRAIIVKKYSVCAENVVSLRNGVDDSYFVKRTIQKKDIPTILYVGRLTSQKNVPRLIEAYSLLKEKAQLRIVGDGEDRNKVEQLIKGLKLSSVTLVGTKSGKELIEEYKNADVLAVPSNKEGGAPLVILEALATGLPVVVSDVYGIRELLGDTVLLVPDPSPENFANALEKVLSSVDLQQELSCKAAEKIKSFRWDTIVNELERIYEEVLS
jgi:glycosyltransferase involved in cell wall biosynthesis